VLKKIAVLECFLGTQKEGVSSGRGSVAISPPPPRFPEDVLVSSMLGAAEAHRPVCVVAVIKRAAYSAGISSSSFFLSWAREPNSIS